MDWARLKRLLRFPPTFRQNLVVLVTSLAGIILLVGMEGYQHGLTLTVGLAVALLAALSAATGMLIYQERQSWAILGELRGAISKIAPTYPSLVQIAPPPNSTLALRKGNSFAHRELARVLRSLPARPRYRNGASGALGDHGGAGRGRGA